MDEDEAEREHAERMRAQKAAQDALVAARRDTKGLLVVHTGDLTVRTTERMQAP